MICALVATPCASAATHTLLILPFENASKAPGIEWIGESFPQVLGERMSVPALAIYSRADRIAAFDRLGIPVNLHPSRATTYRIAEEMDVDYVIMGRYTFDGQTFSATAQLLDMNQLRLHPDVTESGPLMKLIDIQTALAWDVMRLLNPSLATSKNTFVGASQPIRLDALEAYMRGVIAASEQERIRQFNAAIRLKPDYSLALLELGKAYYRQHEYDGAAKALAKIPRSDPGAKEAAFYLGLSAYYLGQFETAENAFAFIASRLPLTEVYNNLGVVTSRRGKKTCVDYFQRAVQADPGDADYHFNLAVALYRAGEMAAAGKQAREALALRPSDSEAKSLLELVNGNGSAATILATPNRAAAQKAPLERIKRNYDEASFRQLAAEIENVTEMRMATQPPQVHARYHIEHGHELLSQGFVGEAEHEFREAIALDQGNATAHAGLAAVLETTGDAAGSRSEALASIGIQPSAEAYLVLARLDLRDNKPGAAREHIERALLLEPGNAAAAMLKRTVQAKLGEQEPR